MARGRKLSMKVNSYNNVAFGCGNKTKQGLTVKRDLIERAEKLLEKQPKIDINDGIMEKIDTPVLKGIKLTIFNTDKVMRTGNNVKMTINSENNKAIMQGAHVASTDENPHGIPTTEDANALFKEYLDKINEEEIYTNAFSYLDRVEKEELAKNTSNNNAYFWR
jgi:hypothetical protein